MLKITMKDGSVSAVSRIAFPMPIYIDAEKFDAFRDAVNALSDSELMDALKKAQKEADEDSDEYAVATDKINALNECGFFHGNDATADILSDGAVRAFCIGISFIPCKAVKRGFAQLYSDAIEYAVTYKESTAWTAQRKQDFNALKDAMCTLFNDTFSAWKKDGFELKLSSKAVNSFLDALYHPVNGNVKKGTERVTKMKREDIYSAYRLYMMSVNMCTGVFAEEKVKTITTF